MAYDEGLAERIRAVLEGRPRITEKKMFGGVAFLSGGHMFVGLVKDELMVRVGPERYEESLARPHARPMDFTGKPMLGYVFVAPAGTAEERDLERWVLAGERFVASLPPKPAAAKRAAPKRAARRPRRKDAY